MEEIILSVCLGLTAYFSFGGEYTEYDMRQRKADSLQGAEIVEYTHAK